jgi:hypothetical protein
MPNHYLIAYASFISVAILLGVMAYKFIRKDNASVGVSLSLAVATTLVSLFHGGWIAATCATSYEVVRAADKLLTAHERKSMRGTSFFCPGTYTFERDGKPTCLSSDGDGHVALGCGD